MSVTLDILRSWRAPRAVMRRQLDAGLREDRALATLMGACLLLFVAQWPVLARAAYLDPSVPLNARLAGALMGTVFIAPLAFYALAGISHIIARALGGRGSYTSARMALFWALLAVSPGMLFQGLVAGFVGPGTTRMITGLAVLGAFVAIWIACLREAELEPAAAAP